MTRSAPHPVIDGKHAFATTQWTVVLRAARPDSPEAAAALATLCRTYWYPLYAFVRRQGCSPHDAQDLTQEFFARLLEKNFLAQVAPEKGRFRSFLRAAMKHFLANEWAKARTQKRGGDRTLLPLDAVGAEQRYGGEPVDLDSADRIYERRWALTLLDHVVGALRADYAGTGRSALFEALKPCLAGDPDALPYAEIATTLGASPGAIKVAAHRLRQRYTKLLRDTVANTVDDPADVDSELRHLLTALSR